MHKIEIPSKNKVIEFPSCWEECSPDQAGFILRLAYQVMDGKLDLLAFRISVFCYLTGLEPDSSYYFRKSSGKAEEINAQIVLLSENLCSWPFKATDAGLELDYKMIVNHFKELKVGNQILIGPHDLLTNISFSQFRNAIREMNDFISLNKESTNSDLARTHLDKFISVLYLAQDVKFNPEDPFKNLSIIAQIEPWIKNSILLFFTSCIKYIQSEDIQIDGNVLNFSELFPKGGNSNKKGIGWTGLLYDIAAERLFGDVMKTDQTGLFDLLTYIYKKHQDNKELEKKYKKKS